MNKRIVDTLEVALARAGFRLLDKVDDDSIVIRDTTSDTDFRISVEEWVS